MSGQTEPKPEEFTELQEVKTFKRKNGTTAVVKVKPKPKGATGSGEPATSSSADKSSAWPAVLTTALALAILGGAGWFVARQLRKPMGAA